MEHDKSPNYKMIPGSREKDTPGTFRDTPVNKYMGAPVNDGHSPIEKHEPGHIELSVDTPSGPKAPRGPQSGKVLGIPVTIQTKGRSTKNTDLLELGKKAYKEAKDKIKSYFN